MMGLDPLREVRGVGLDQYRASLGDYLDAVASDAWAANPVSAIGRLVDMAQGEQEARRAGQPLLSPQEASERGRDIGLRFEAPIAESAYNVLAESKRAQLARESVFRRARLEGGYGTLPWLLAGGTEFLTMAADPLNVASAFVPVIGPARYASWAARAGALPATLARGAVEGAVGQALLEPVLAADQAALGNEYSMLDTLVNLGFGAGLGVVLHGAGYGIGAGFRFMRNGYRAIEPEAAASSLRAVVVEKIDEPPPRQPIAEAVEALRPETKDAALRTAIAQLVQDKPVDVDAVVRADPGHAAALADIEALQARSAASAKEVAGAIEPPADWRPSAEALREARRIVRGWTPEVALERPQSLSDFVMQSGGLRADAPEAAELRAANVNLMAKEGGGRSVDRLAQAASEAGYRFGAETRAGSGIDIDGFVAALIEDSRQGTPRFADDSYTSAWQAQQRYFDELQRYLRDTLELDPRGMDPRQLAWLLRQDETTARTMALLRRIDSLDEHASLELAARLEQERVELERQILSDEPGAVEPDAPKADHRDFPAATLEELERFYDDVQGSHGEAGTGGQAAGGPPAGRRPQEGGEAPPAGRGGDAPAAEEARLRRADGEEGTEGDRPGAEELAGFAERQAGADLHADPAALAVRDERLAGEAREVRQLLADDLRDFGHVLDDDARTIFDAAGRIFDDEAAAIDALAACRGGV